MSLELGPAGFGRIRRNPAPRLELERSREGFPAGAANTPIMTERFFTSSGRPIGWAGWAVGWAVVLGFVWAPVAAALVAALLGL